MENAHGPGAPGWAWHPALRPAWKSVVHCADGLAADLLAKLKARKLGLHIPTAHQPARASVRFTYSRDDATTEPGTIYRGNGVNRPFPDYLRRNWPGRKA